MQVYLVGGAVRDSILNYPFHERDWVVVGAEPQQLLDQGYQQVGKDFPVFLHPDTKEEYALARTERKSGKGYAGFECYSAANVTLEEDLQRRDLTINAIAQDPEGNLIDPYKGQHDIDNKLLRHVSDAFTEDPLRVIRTARFYARYYHLGFRIADETAQLMRSIASSGELEHLSRERVWVETEKALNERSPEYYFIALKSSHALSRLFPMFSDLTIANFDIINSQQSNSFTAAQRFALLFSHIPINSKDNTTNIGQALKALKIPKEFIELAQLVHQQHRFISQTNLTAFDALNILKHCDAYRRPERFFQLLECCERIKNTGNDQRLQRALDTCENINAAKLAQQGLKGPEIAQALHQQRLKALTASFTQ